MISYIQVIKMLELKSVFKTNPEAREEVDFGKIRLTLKQYLDKNQITRNQLSSMTGIKFQTIDRYYKTEFPEKVDCVLLSKMCYSLSCSLEDIIAYEKPNN